MKNIYILALFFLLMVTAVLGQFYLRKETSNEIWLAQANTYLEGLLVLDGEINESMIRNRFNLDSSYDNLAKATRAFSEGRTNLSIHLNNKPSVMGALKGKINRLEVLFESKKDVIESFKSHNAVLRNSVIYAPTVGHELIDISSRLPESMMLEKSLYTLNTNILKYTHSNFDEKPEAIRMQLNQLDSDGYEFPGFAGITYSEFNNHVQTVLDEKPSTDQYLASALLVPVKEELYEIKDRLSYVASASSAIYNKVDYFLSAYFAVFLISFLFLAFILYRHRESISVAVEARTRVIESENINLRKTLNSDTPILFSNPKSVDTLELLQGSLRNATRNLGALQFQIVEVNRLVDWIKKLSDTLSHGSTDKSQANDLIKKVVINYRDLYKRHVFNDMQNILRDSKENVDSARNLSSELNDNSKGAPA